MNPRARRLRRLRREARKREPRYTFRQSGPGTFYEAPAKSDPAFSITVPASLTPAEAAELPRIVRTRIDGMKRPPAPKRTGPVLPKRGSK